MTSILSSDAMDCDVLVVGAGPVGLTLAADLARRGRQVRIIDQLPTPTTESRAIVVHSRSIDHLEALGVLPDLLARALIVQGMQFHEGESVLGQVSFERILAAHPWSASVLQTDTEAILTQRLRDLGVEIERARTLVACRDDDDTVSSVVRDPRGRSATLRSRFLIGADGARSTVRRLSGQKLTGSFTGESFLIADVDAEQDFPPELFHAFFGETVSLLFPLPRNRVRIIAQLSDDPAESSTPSESSVQRVMDERGIRLRITRSHWITRFELKHGQVPRYRDGHVLLAGDAAHIHSPAGGLGMNTGIHDAMNLGWKLDLALSRAGHDDLLLDSYQEERHPVAASVIRFTTRLSKAGTLASTPGRRLRNSLFHLGLESTTFSGYMAQQIEQQNIRYRHSSLVSGRGGRLRPGDYLYVPGVRIADELRRHPGHLGVPLVEGTPIELPPAIRRLSLDSTQRDSLADACGRPRDGVVLVRPDGYIGFIGPASQVATYPVSV